LNMSKNVVMCKMTGAAALHVLLIRIAFAQDAFEVFGWTARTLFTLADYQVRNAEFDDVMDERDWRTYTKVVRAALRPVRKGVYRRFIWAMDIVCARLMVMDDLSDGETDHE
jgi:hypothetical protein